jgi:hypothetical protein
MGNILILFAFLLLPYYIGHWMYATWIHRNRTLATTRVSSPSSGTASSFLEMEDEPTVRFTRTSLPKE